MATENVDESPSLLLERNFAYFKDTLLQIQCHNFNWEYEKNPRAVANMLIGDLKRILKCAVYLKENRILLLTDELDPPTWYEPHENLRKFVDIGFECRHFHGDLTISHVGHYADLVSIAAYGIVNCLDQSVLEEDIVYDFPQYEPDVYKYLPLIPKAHSTPHDRMQELVHAIEGLDLDFVIVSYLCVLFVYVYMCKNQCICLTLSTLFAFCFTYNIDACYLNGAQVVTESSRLKHWPKKTIMLIYNTTITTIIQYVIWVISN